MSIATIRSAALLGVDAHPVDVEVAIVSSLPGMKTLGLPDAALREGKDRILLAIRNQKLVEGRPSVIVNLAPAELRKSGSGYELAIALGILVAAEQVPRDKVAGLLVVGELSLDGRVRPVRGALVIAALARAQGASGLVVPAANAREASLIGDLNIYAVNDLRELADGLRGDTPLEPYRPDQTEPTQGATRPANDELDFADVRGQAHARRAAEVAAAGGHNLLFIGPPGSGKTMIARRIPSILPPLETEEAITTTAVLSVAGLLGADAGLVRRRPFRAPHHTISSAGLVGGYAPPRPGEVSLAHNGVLFLDELAEFSRRSLESLREPVEEGCLRVVRCGVSVVYPARCMLIAATNPCPCGYLGDTVRVCRCGQGAVDRYRGRLSGPLLDRIDLHVEVPRLTVDELDGDNAEGSAAILRRVEKARSRQLERGLGAPTNAQLGERAIRRLVKPSSAERQAMNLAVERLGLSPRAYVRVLRVARTIADLDAARKVELPHILEALQYRSLDRVGQ